MLFFTELAPKMRFPACLIFNDLQSLKMAAHPCAADRLVKTEFHQTCMKMRRPLISRGKNAEPDYYTKDCAMAARHIEQGLNDGTQAVAPFSLVRKAYGI